MFSRRHPHLFFILVFSTIAAVTAVVLTLVVTLGLRGTWIDGMIPDGKEVVGVIEVTGVIRDARDALDQLKAFRENTAVKAIVVRIDSPGGGVGPSQEIYREVRKTLKQKPVVASMGTVAASGGYYIAAAASKIIANPGTITGSIGVIMGFTNYEELLQKIGLTPIVVKSGEYKDMGSPVRKMTEPERRMFEELAEKIHGQFIRDIVEGRGISRDKVEALADGRIFTGEESKSFGLIDRLGNLEDAIDWAGRLGGIEGEVIAVSGRENTLSFLEYLLFHSPLKAVKEHLIFPRIRADFIYDPVRSDSGSSRS